MIEGHNFWCPLIVNLTVKLGWLIGHGFDSWNGKKTHLFRQDNTTWMCTVQFPEDFLRQGFQKTKQNCFKSFGWFKLQPHGWRLSLNLLKMMMEVKLMMMMMRLRTYFSPEWISIVSWGCWLMCKRCHTVCSWKAFLLNVSACGFWGYQLLYRSSCIVCNWKAFLRYEPACVLRIAALMLE